MDKLFSQEFVLLDGAMGTMLQTEGMPAGTITDIYAITNPKKTEALHRAYIDAGSKIIYASTFSANARKLKGSTYSVSEVIKEAVYIAKRASNGKALVALDIGPIGDMMEPAGALTFDDAYEIFREVIVAGVKAGVDIIAFETFSDLAELRAGVLAAKEACSLPIFATMTFEESSRTFTGALAESFAVTMEGLGVDAIGANCSSGPKKLAPTLHRMAQVTSLPLIVKANAGLPDARDGHYDMDVRQFAEEMLGCAVGGVKFIGGCCGTTPSFIKELKLRFAGKEFLNRPFKSQTLLCSATKLIALDSPRIIGERINPSGKNRFQQALQNKNFDYVQTLGVSQMDAGADILDVNVGVPGLDESELMKKSVESLSSVTNLPLQIDSGDPTVIEIGLRTFCGKAIINSVTCEKTKLSSILPLAKKYGAAVIGLTIDEEGIPKSAEKRLEIAEKILTAALGYGIPKSDVIIDCLCMTVSSDQNSAVETLRAVRMVKEKLGLHCVLGISNISFGLPNRELINSSFLTLALENGVDLLIINPNTKAMVDAVSAYKLLRGFDFGCDNYIERFTDEKDETSVTNSPDTAKDIRSAISKGLISETVRITEELLKEKSGIELINDLIIPALDEVGERFESGEIYLPQLVRSADAAGTAIELVKQKLPKIRSSEADKGKIILATVKGDIHDIGKNIVKSVLSSYGYAIIDLGRDVSPELIVEAAIDNNVKLVGLSALMTTTLPAMAESIKALRKSEYDGKIMVGGAVLTPDYSAEIGADYYSKDAKGAADIAKIVLDGCKYGFA